MHRETQLRAFYSTTEEISALFTKQQEQLKAMQRALEDDDDGDGDGALGNDNSLQGTPRRDSPAADGGGGGEDCTQDMEHVPETESPGPAGALGEGGDAVGETMQLEDDACGGGATAGGSCSQLPVRTADLLASEGLGSWANSTAPSVHGENDYPPNGGGGVTAIAASALGSFDASQNDATFPIPSAAGLHAQFPGGGSGGNKGDSMSDAETEEGGDSGGDEDDSGGSIGSGDLVMIQDSVG